MSEWSFEQKAIEAGLTAVTSAITLGLGWFVGLKLSAKWSLRQKRRELEYSAANELYRLYGEFFAVWKLWNYFCEGHVSTEAKDTRWELLKRAAAVDAGFEALLVKISSERVISADAAESAGRLRQGFQQLRQSIKLGKPLEWRFSSHPQYLEFKTQACRFANLMTSDHDFSRPILDDAHKTLEAATDNRHESAWLSLTAAKR